MENTWALLLTHNKNIKGLKLDTYKTLKTIFKSKHLSKEVRHAKYLPLQLGIMGNNQNTRKKYISKKAPKLSIG